MDVSFNHLVIDRIGFEKIFDFLPYPFLLAESAGDSYHVIYVNQKFLAEVGYECEEIYTMNDWFTRAYPDEDYRNEVRNAWGELFWTAKSEGQDSVQMKALIHTKHNGDKWYEVKSSITGEFQMVAFVNIHEVVSQEKELRKLNENKNNILSVLTHDLRSPIISLHSLTEMALSKVLSQEEFFEVIRTLNEKSRKTLDLLDTTLLWSKSNFETIRIVKKETDVEDLINSILSVYESSYHDKKLNVKADIRKPMLKTDPDVIAVLFRNLLSNAIKFTPVGGTIEILTEQIEKDFVLSIQDTGPGLTAKQLQKLQALQISSSLGTNEEKGFGIGLKLCSQLARKIKAELVFESEPGAGTCARVVIH